MKNLTERVISKSLSNNLASIYKYKRQEFKKTSNLFKPLAGQIRLRILNDRRAHGDLRRLYETFISDTDYTYFAEFIADMEQLLQDMGGHAEEDAPEESEESESESEANASLRFLLNDFPKIELKSEDDRIQQIAEINKFYNEQNSYVDLPLVTLAGAEWKLGLQALPRYRFLDDKLQPYEGTDFPSLDTHKWMDVRLTPALKIMAFNLRNISGSPLEIREKEINAINPDLVCALVKIEGMNLVDAITFAGECCERCNNLLGYRYSLGYGYPHTSDEAEKCSTKCSCCKQIDPKYYWKLHDSLGQPSTAPSLADNTIQPLPEQPIPNLQPAEVNLQPVAPENTPAPAQHSAPNPDAKQVVQQQTEQIPAQQSGDPILINMQHADQPNTTQVIQDEPVNRLGPSIFDNVDKPADQAVVAPTTVDTSKPNNNEVDRPKNNDPRIHSQPPIAPHAPLDNWNDNPPMQRKLT